MVVENPISEQQSSVDQCLRLGAGAVRCSAVRRWSRRIHAARRCRRSPRRPTGCSVTPTWRELTTTIGVSSEAAVVETRKTRGATYSVGADKTQDADYTSWSRFIVGAKDRPWLGDSFDLVSAASSKLK